MQTPGPSWYGVRTMRLLVPPTLGLLLGGCGLVSSIIQPMVETSAGKWHQVGPVRRDLEEIATLTRDLILRQDFTIPDFKPTEGLIMTDWKVRLSPRFREGTRTKIEVNFHPESDGSTLIRLRSYREINENSELPMIADQADWVGASIDEKQSRYMDEPAMKLQQMLKLKLFGLRRE